MIMLVLLLVQQIDLRELSVIRLKILNHLSSGLFCDNRKTECEIMRLSAFGKYSWFVLIYIVFVILWGAYVRATGAGAGCGSHWPLCNGEVVPREPEINTVIEFGHRLTSGLAFLFVLILFIWAFRIFQRNDPVRLGAILSLIFIITEALVGAGLVLFEWVAFDDSVGRVVSIGVHLVNTFLLLASLSLTAWWASGGRPIRITGHWLLVFAFVLAFLGIIFIGISGAITALGDTLFPVESLAEGIEQDFQESSHFLIRLRVWHPIIAISVGFYVIFLSLMVGLFKQRENITKMSVALVILFIIQLVAGVINLVLLAPVWMQLVHLLLADLVWITLVLLFASTYGVPTSENQEEFDSG